MGLGEQPPLGAPNVPPTATDMGSVIVGHNVTLNQDALMSQLTINALSTLTASDASPRTLTISNNVNGTNLINSGAWANGAGGLKMHCRNGNTYHFRNKCLQ